MSSVVLDSSASASQVPAVYAETLVCGGGGVVAAADPSVGVKFSRNYGALGAQTELLAQVSKNIYNPAAPAGEVGGTVSCAGLRFGNINSVADTLNAGTKVCGVCQLTAGTATITATGMNVNSPTDRALVFLNRFSDTNTYGATGVLCIGSQTGSSFIINSVDAAGAIVAGDTSFVYWMIINPDWS